MGLISVLALLLSQPEELAEPPPHFLSSPVSWPDLHMGQAGEYIELVLSVKYHPVAITERIPTLQSKGNIQAGAVEADKYRSTKGRRVPIDWVTFSTAGYLPCSLNVDSIAAWPALCHFPIMALIFV